MERSVFMREQDNRVYSVHTYYAAKVVSEMPFGLVLAMIFSLIVYWMIGFNDADAVNFFIFYMSYVSPDPTPPRAVAKDVNASAWMLHAHAGRTCCRSTRRPSA